MQRAQAWARLRPDEPRHPRAKTTTQQRLLATLKRTVGRGGFHYGVSHGHDDGLGDRYRYTATLTNLDALGDAAQGQGALSCVDSARTTLGMRRSSP